MKDDWEVLSGVMDSIGTNRMLEYLKENMKPKEILEELDCDIEEIARIDLDMIKVDEIEEIKQPYQSRGISEGDFN